jgi:hypothetical protein
VPDDVLPQFLPDPVRLAEALVTARLWKRVRGGYKFVPGVTHKIPLKQAVENERKLAAERQRRSREARSSRRDNGVSHGVSHSAQSNPDPRSSAEVVNLANGSSARASPDLIDLITTEIKTITGSEITPEWADRIAGEILKGRSIASPLAYVRSAIRSETDPRTRFLPLY